MGAVHVKAEGAWFLRMRAGKVNSRKRMGRHHNAVLIQGDVDGFYIGAKKRKELFLFCNRPVVQGTGADDSDVTGAEL